MLWFKRLFASRHKPVGMPNFATAPWVDIDLSGTKLRFKTPPKSQDLIPPQYWPEKLDIYNLDNFRIWPNEKGGVKTIFKNHWAYFGNLFDNDTGDIAGLDVQITVTRQSLIHRPYDNLLHAKQSLYWCFDCQYEDYDNRNERIKKNYPQRLADAMEEFGTTEFAPPLTLHIHPQSPEDIETLTPPPAAFLFLFIKRS